MENEGFYHFFRALQVIVSVGESIIDILMLYMFVQFSKPHAIRQFDKVCKQKFLMYLQSIPRNDVEQIHAVKQNLSRYMLRLEAKQRRALNDTSVNHDTYVNHETVGIFGSSGKIVKHELVTIFMTILMYAPKERRDYLKGNLSIEEEFKAEIDNIEKLGKLYLTSDTVEINIVESNMASFVYSPMRQHKETFNSLIETGSLLDKNVMINSFRTRSLQSSVASPTFAGSRVRSV